MRVECGSIASCCAQFGEQTELPDSYWLLSNKKAFGRTSCADRRLVGGGYALGGARLLLIHLLSGKTPWGLAAELDAGETAVQEQVAVGVDVPNVFQIVRQRRDLIAGERDAGHANHAVTTIQTQAVVDVVAGAEIDLAQDGEVVLVAIDFIRQEAIATADGTVVCHTVVIQADRRRGVDAQATVDRVFRGTADLTTDQVVGDVDVPVGFIRQVNAEGLGVVRSLEQEVVLEAEPASAGEPAESVTRARIAVGEVAVDVQFQVVELRTQRQAMGQGIVKPAVDRRAVQRERTEVKRGVDDAAGSVHGSLRVVRIESPVGTANPQVVAQATTDGDFVTTAPFVTGRGSSQKCAINVGVVEARPDRIGIVTLHDQTANAAVPVGTARSATAVSKSAEPISSATSATA